MKSTNRRAEILQIIEHDGKVSVEQLITKYEVSEETLRRDLRILADSGYVKRVYGGAEKVEKASRYIPYEDRLSIQYNEKRAIGKECLTLIEKGDSIFLDGKTTCLVFAGLIPVDLELTIVTNSIVLANHLWSKQGKWKIHLLGGELNADGLLNGPKLYHELREYRFDKAIFSCIGLDEKGCYFAKADAQQLAVTLKEITSSLILLADSSKINRHAFLYGLTIDDFSYIVTDSEAPKIFVKHINQTNCNIRLANVKQGEILHKDK
ncbi:DeoR/GlpR family DNA-binding transcription regulator [Gracilibacillus lacisalsi]|uniref:DeoR/GlpR family DNA-binding transcription regulator n=1 Tax=Gracilibacillus lacisalsi TaxID=393087 RepID=UPI000369262C|nr:DeoR/GlpR family DNA-binding transcription regulator [Gracilibacillus lacisalsi]